MIRLDVWITEPEGAFTRCGELAFGDADAHGRYASAFRYVPEYLRKKSAFPLDPRSLPLSSTEFGAGNLKPPLAVFEDALPDSWGRRLLILEAKLARKQQSEPYLLRSLAGRGLGALLFFPPGLAPSALDLSADILELDELVHAADAIQAGEEITDRMRALLRAGSSPGGARPKALVRAGGRLWLAKMPASKDEADVVRLEAATLRLAAGAGLTVPANRLAFLNDGRAVLLVERFDVTEQGGRRHMLSLQTLMCAAGVYVLRYEDVFAAVRRYSDHPDHDVPALFRQMVFNACVGNTDDHLKNFWMLRDRAGYRLSPAFDLLPDIANRREHILLFDLSPYAPRPVELVESGRKLGVPTPHVIVDEVVEAVRDFAPTALEIGVPPKEIDRFAKDISKRISG